MRLRYRDTGLAWSDWSEPVAFSAGGVTLAEGLVSNPGAEEGVGGWTLVEGKLESLIAEECGGISPATGERYFSVGGLCEPTPYAEAHQSIALESAWWPDVDAGGAVAVFGATFATWAGEDTPTLALQALDSEGAALGEPVSMASQATSWTAQTLTAPLPPMTRALRLVMTGTQVSGADNDSYVDDVHLTLMACPAP